MKIKLTTLLMIVLVTIIITIAGANLAKYLQTDIAQETNPSTLHSQQNLAGGQTATVTMLRTDNITESPVNTGGVTAIPLIPDPVNTVYDFYDYVEHHNCQEANDIRPDYSGCPEVASISHINVTPIQIENDRAAVRLELAYTKEGKPEESFDGYIWLKRGANRHWQIQPDFISKDKMKIPDFLQHKAGIPPKALADAPLPDTNKLDIPPEQTAQQPVDNKPTETAESEYNAPPPPTGRQIDPLAVRSFGSQRILNACWSPAQLRGSPIDKKLKETTPDHSSPERLFSKHQLKPLQPGLQGSIRTVRIPDPNKKLVALTFDLCERASEVTGYDADLVNYLRDHGIKATFYAGGKWMRSHPDKAKQLMADPQFEIGNHAWTHGNMRVLSGDELQNQVRWTQAEYELLWEDLSREVQQCPGVSPDEIRKIPPLPLSFRYPYGTCGVEALDFMAEQGLPSIQWNIVTADPWRKQTADGIAKTILQGIKPGSIIIAHANGRGWKTSEALSKFIPQLREKGYEFVTVTELLQEGVAVEAKDSCYELKPGDNAFYDKKVGEGTE